MRTYSRANEASLLARRKRAELTSGLGAGVLGAGLGAVLADAIRHGALPLILLGALMHARGMWEKHRLETVLDAANPWWVTLLYWTCWALLLALGVYLVGQRFW